MMTYSKMMILIILQFCFVTVTHAITVTGVQQKPVNRLYRVTLAIFSGRPDPEWTVASSSISIESVTSYDPSEMPPRLGYKGFLVHSGSEQVRLLVGPETRELQLKLFETMPEDLLSPEVMKEIRSEIKNSKDVQTFITSLPGRRRRNAPPYAPGQWQTRRRQLCNNCYNYANNRPTYNYAQPGFNKVEPPQQLTYADEIHYKALRDGLTDVPPQAVINGVPVQPADNRHVVALVIWPPRADFHWYRMDNRRDANGNALWSHKQGQAPVTDLDNANQPITNPSGVGANLGPYIFVRYMYSQPHVNIAGRELCEVR